MDFSSIKEGVISYFSMLYKDPPSNQIIDQLKVLKNLPSIFNEEEGLMVGRDISLEEVDNTLKSFSRYKSPGPDGWPVELYMFFFSMLGNEMLATINETRISGCIPAELNKTYLTLIPKVDRPLSFGDYRPIALCNILYKIITKIIAGRLQAGTGTFIYAEQFDFLPGRQISDAVGIV